MREIRHPLISATLQWAAASRRAKGDGKRIRRARNYVKRWQNSPRSWNEYMDMAEPAKSELLEAIRFRRYQRAMAILVANALAES